MYQYSKVFHSVILDLGNKAADDSAQLFMYVGLKPAVSDVSANLRLPHCMFIMNKRVNEIIISQPI